MLGRNILTKAHRSNTAYVEPHVSGREGVGESVWWALTDPQTSGGLLLSVSPEGVDALLTHLSHRFPRAAVIGRVSERQESAIRLV